MDTKVQVYSVFHSINGEVCSQGIGSPTTFVRFSGCTATCDFCDTVYAKDPKCGVPMTIKDLYKTIQSFGCRNVTITGGEPLEQRDSLEKLIAVLFDAGYRISIETNGFHAFSKAEKPYSDANWVVDIKKSGYVLMDSLVQMQLGPDDFFKMVVGSETDFKEFVTKKKFLQNAGAQARFAFSPEFGECSANKVLGWIKKYKQMDAHLNVQLHKVCCLDEAN